MNNKAIFAVISLAAIIADQMTKALTRLNFSIGESVPVIKDIFHLTYVTNTGSAFGLFKGLNAIFIIISIIVIFVIINYFYSNYIKNMNNKNNGKNRIESVLLALLLG
ncbi:signal peptidase II, partial [Candidatus Woesearchaeota archaeon]|nr:signal peptidase II [Candidatus Woesearchaeota archaeon]